jgi:hypothetical protein
MDVSSMFSTLFSFLRNKINKDIIFVCASFLSFLVYLTEGGLPPILNGANWIIENRSSLFLICVFLWILLLVSVVKGLWLWVTGLLSSNKKRKELLEERKKVLSSLTAEERGYLVWYIQKGKTVIYIDLEDGVGQGLAMKGLLYPTASLVDLLKGAPYGIVPWAKEYLNNNPT